MTMPSATMQVYGSSTIEISDPNLITNEPLVSVYMLTYNHERFVAEAIEGVVAQRTNFQFELIIGEDCSTDGTGEIVREYQRRFPNLIRILTSQHNVGMHANGVRCKKALRGRYVAICEGDDFWHCADKLQLQVDVMIASPEVTLCHTEFDRKIGFRVKRNRHQKNHAETTSKYDVYIQLLQEWTVMTATALYRADTVSAFSDGEFNNPAWPFEDYNLALYASVTGRVAYLPLSTATWRRVAGSASNSGPKKSLEMHTAATECRYAFMEAYPIAADQKASVEYNIHQKFLRLSFIANRPDVYRTSLKWLINHGYESPSAKHLLRQIAMKTRLPVAVILGVRNFSRAVADYQF